jgi:hypothetical protein
MKLVTQSTFNKILNLDIHKQREKMLVQCHTINLQCTYRTNMFKQQKNKYVITLHEWGEFPLKKPSAITT